MEETPHSLLTFDTVDRILNIYYNNTRMDNMIFFTTNASFYHNEKTHEIAGVVYLVNFIELKDK